MVPILEDLRHGQPLIHWRARIVRPF
jgi:hypothetical protein